MKPGHLPLCRVNRGGGCNCAASFPEDQRPQIERAGDLVVIAYPVPKMGSPWRAFLRRDRARAGIGDAGTVVATVRAPQSEADERRETWALYGGVGDPPPKQHPFACSARTSTGKFDCGGRVKDCRCAECGTLSAEHP